MQNALFVKNSIPKKTKYLQKAHNTLWFTYITSAVLTAKMRQVSLNDYTVPSEINYAVPYASKFSQIVAHAAE